MSVKSLVRPHRHLVERIISVGLRNESPAARLEIKLGAALEFLQADDRVIAPALVPKPSGEGSRVSLGEGACWLTACS